MGGGEGCSSKGLALICPGLWLQGEGGDPGDHPGCQWGEILTFGGPPLQGGPGLGGPVSLLPPAPPHWIDNTQYNNPTFYLCGYFLLYYLPLI